MGAVLGRKGVGAVLGNGGGCGISAMSYDC